MNYSEIPDTLSRNIRDASLDHEETRFIFEDPHQCWKMPRRRICDDELIDILSPRENPNSF